MSPKNRLKRSAHKQLHSGGVQMFFYVNLIMLSLTGVAFLAYLFFVVSDHNISFTGTLLSYILSLLTTFILTKKSAEREYSEIIDSLKEEYKIKIHRLKREHDTTTLEKTIRDGTQALIKNALDYFKLENIKNEMGNSAAIQNLQLDKYGQIIELLAEFSLILPDVRENQEIVQTEIVHQIEIYRIDEKPFAIFLQRIMEKYVMTVKKKMSERNDANMRSTKRCPKCAEKILLKAVICKHCGHDFNAVRKAGESEWLKKGQNLYYSKNYQDALGLFSNVIDLNPKSGHAYYNRGMTYEKIGNIPRSREDMSIAAKLGHKKAREIIGKFPQIKIVKTAS